MSTNRSFHPGRLLIWGLFALGLIVAPLVFRSSMALTMLSQMGYVIIICLSYNMIFGQGGMLSFGHAVYTGAGGFAAVWAMNHVTAGQLPVPLPFIPLAGGLAGVLLAFVSGYVITKKAGTTFAMITLGIGELVAACANMFPGLFGGDGGITTDRTYSRFLGWNFGAQVQVYYLIAFYCFVCTALMYAFTGTPLGRMLNAVRDNPERVSFIGYNTQLVRWFSFIISGFFAGVGGALASINFEIVNAGDAFSGARSGSYLLFTFLGGAGFFFGPIIGAVLLVLASVVLSELTQAWLLYLGAAFLLMVMFAPGGIASLIMANQRVIKAGHFGRLGLPYAGVFVTALAALFGVAGLIEMIYFRQLGAGSGTAMKFMGWPLDVSSAGSWLAVTAVAVVGLGLFGLAWRHFARAWGEVQETIEARLNPAREAHA
ncbi:MAG: branched-chain amino acid ABC transporter permease [Xenophilus sp.]